MGLFNWIQYYIKRRETVADFLSSDEITAAAEDKWNVNIFFVRHGQSMSNAGYYKRDPELTPQGVRLSRLNGVQTRARLPKIHFVGCSTLLRTMETAFYFMGERNKPIYVVPFVNELHPTSPSDNPYPEDIQTPRLRGKPISYSLFRGMEETIANPSIESFIGWLATNFKDVLEKSLYDKESFDNRNINIVVFTHGAAMVKYLFTNFSITLRNIYNNETVNARYYIHGKRYAKAAIQRLDIELQLPEPDKTFE